MVWVRSLFEPRWLLENLHYHLAPLQFHETVQKDTETPHEENHLVGSLCADDPAVELTLNSRWKYLDETR